MPLNVNKMQGEGSKYFIDHLKLNYRLKALEPIILKSTGPFHWRYLQNENFYSGQKSPHPGYNRGFSFGANVGLSLIYIKLI